MLHLGVASFLFCGYNVFVELILGENKMQVIDYLNKINGGMVFELEKGL